MPDSTAAQKTDPKTEVIHLDFGTVPASYQKLKDHFKSKCAKERRTMKEVILQLMTEYVN